MSTTEILISIGGAFFGYWIVSKLMVDKPPSRPAPAPEPEYEPTTQAAADEPDLREPAWYEVLNVAPDASTAQIKHAYRMLMSQYHPDKVATLGEELKAVAERKSKQINAAYEAILRVRGESA